MPTPAVANPDSSPPSSSPSPAEKTTSLNKESSSIDITLTKFQPMKGEPGQSDYSNARLSYRITAAGSKNLNFPTINFSVGASPKLFERRFAPPADTAPLQPGQSVDRTVSLDPTAEAEWSAAYAKTDKAKFSWSVEGQSGGEVEMPVHKPWP
jgi:hypothetical protein